MDEALSEAKEQVQNRTAGGRRGKQDRTLLPREQKIWKYGWGSAVICQADRRRGRAVLTKETELSSKGIVCIHSSSERP